MPTAAIIKTTTAHDTDEFVNKNALIEVLDILEEYIKTHKVEIEQFIDKYHDQE